MKNRIKLLVASVPVTLLIISIIAFIINTRIAEGKPVIETLSPNIVFVDEVLDISGDNFGKIRENSNVFFSSIELLSKNIISWSDTHIKIRVPDKAGSGLITVKTERGMSEPVIVVIEENVPFIGTGAYLPGFPFIETVDPNAGGAGDIVTFTGDNFGNKKNNSSILFSSDFSRERDTLSGDTVLENFLEIDSENIISWENKSISIYLPEFIKTGDVYVRTESGFSNAAYFELENRHSFLVLGEKKSYMFSQSVLLEREEEPDSGYVNLWFASPVNTIYQRNIVNLPNSYELSPQSCNDVILYRLLLDKGAYSENIVQNTIVDVYEQNYSIDTAEINDTYDKQSPLFMRYTASTEMIPSSAQRVKTVGTSITRRKADSYSKAHAIYEYILARLTYSEDLESVSPDLVIDSQLGDSKAYSLLFCALARTSGIPARPVTGFLVDSDKNTKSHWWAEFFIPGFGWFPLDPALADGLDWENHKENPVEYYWGNIDNQHIAFTRGEKVVPRLFPDGTVYSEIDNAFLTHSVETDRSIINLHSSWSDVKMSAIY